jgi:hypothetical protein
MEPTPNNSTPATCPVGFLSNGGAQRYLLEAESTTGFVAWQITDGTILISEAKQVSLKSSQSVSFWSCAGYTDTTPAGKITFFDCHDNSLTQLDVRALAGLEFLDCSFNQLSRLPLDGLTELELHALCIEANTDLCKELRMRIREWIVQKPQGDVANARVLLIVVFPKTRIQDGPVEQREVWAFCVPHTVNDLAVALGVKDKQKGMTAYIVGEDSAVVSGSKATEIGIGQLRTVYTLTPANAALFNGFKEADSTKVLGIGMGAIGSQVFDNLFRSGFGEWTLVDNDILLPHNCARHALAGDYVGHNKAICLAHVANTTVEGSTTVKYVAADVLQPGAEKSSRSARISG